MLFEDAFEIKAKDDTDNARLRSISKISKWCNGVVIEMHKETAFGIYTFSFVSYSVFATNYP